MTPTEYAAKLRHAADVIERLGVVPLLNEVPRFQIQPEDFGRCFAGETVERLEHGGLEHLRGTIDDVQLCTVRGRVWEEPRTTITLPKEAV